MANDGLSSVCRRGIPCSTRLREVRRSSSAAGGRRDGKGGGLWEGGVKGTREARGVFRASCRGVQQVIVFGIHLHASSVPSLSLSLSHFSSLFIHPLPFVPPRRTLRYSIHGISLYWLPRLQPAGWLYPIAISRENSSQRGKPRYSDRRRPISIKSCRHSPPLRGSPRSLWISSSNEIASEFSSESSRKFLSFFIFLDTFKIFVRNKRNL